MQLSIEEIKYSLTVADVNQIENPYPPGILDYPVRQASVLIPMLLEDETWHLLYIRRTANQYDPHSGQVAFPGGARDFHDTNEIETALREAKEEIGINPSDITILGRLKNYMTITNYIVTPIICSFPWPYKLKLAKREVSRAFTIPLEWLADPENQQTQSREIPNSGVSIPVTYFHSYKGEVLWGASARITLGLIEVLFGSQSVN